MITKDLPLVIDKIYNIIGVENSHTSVMTGTDSIARCYQNYYEIPVNTAGIPVPSTNKTI
jgi:hypothetical protein